MKKGKAAPPSPEFLRLKSELDRARRELSRLKQIAGEAAAAESAPVEVPEAVDDAELAAAAADEGGVADTDAGADGTHGEVETLRREVAELGQTKQRLSRLYFSQVEENRKRGQKLHQILGSISAISSELELDVVLQRVADTIRDRLGYRVVTIRLREAGTQRLEARAFAGVDEAGRAQLAQDEVTLDEFRSWLKPESQVSRSYFISQRHRPDAPPQELAGADAPREEWEWQPGDRLLVPVLSRGGELTACFAVEDPADKLVPSRESVELLEVLANHAAVAIENARLVHQLEHHSHDLEATNHHLQEMHALKGNFISAVSHELRTPLTSIRAYVDTMLSARDGDMAPEQARRFLGIVNAESRRLARLIESMLDLSRFDSGTRRTRQALDFAEVVGDAVAVLRPIAETGQVALKVQNADADTGMEADRDQMKQLVLHLGSHAVKFTPPGGVVTLRLSGDPRDVVLEVEDTGGGIPEAQLDEVFERLDDANSSPARPEGGARLGLAICKAIVEWHGGRISVESEPGQGSRFTVVLPRCSGPSVAMPAAVGQGPAADVLRLAIEMVAEVMNARVVSLFAPDQGGELVMQAATGLDADQVRTSRLAPGRGVAGWVAKQRRPVCVSGPDAVREAERGGDGTGTFLSAPLEGQDGLLGVLSVTDPASGRPFGADDCALLLQLADRVATAWEEARALERREKNVEGTKRALRQVIESVERGREAAPDRAPLARRTARRLGLSEPDAGLISYAATVRDVGMTRIDESLRANPNPLNGAERDALERHPELGAEWLRPLEEMGAVRDIVLAHQEWWDGSGYPRGLAADAIPVGARIVAVVDAWESMNVGRRHRPARSADDAMAELKRLAGRQFDPAVVDAFESAWRELERERAENGGATEPTASEKRG